MSADVRQFLPFCFWFCCQIWPKFRLDLDSLWKLRLLNLFEFSSPGASFGMRFSTTAKQKEGSRLSKLVSVIKQHNFHSDQPSRSLVLHKHPFVSPKQYLSGFQKLSLDSKSSRDFHWHPHEPSSHPESLKPTHYCQVV